MMVASVMHQTPSVAPSVGAWMRRKKVGMRTRPKEPMAANAAPTTAKTAVSTSAHSGNASFIAAPTLGTSCPRCPPRGRELAWGGPARRSFDHLPAQQELGDRRRPDEAEQRDHHRGLEVDVARVDDAQHHHHEH